MEPVTVAMPIALSPEMIRAIKNHPLTSIDDIDVWHERLGWLVCVWDVLIAQKTNNTVDSQATGQR